MILEPGEYFIVKLLVLHKTDSVPGILAYGKIAGQQKIDVVNSIDTKQDDSFLKRTYRGNIWVQLLRLISYAIVTIVLLVIIIIISENIDAVKNKNRRKKRINEFKNLKSYEYTKMDDAIFDRYLNHDSISFQEMSRLLKNEILINTTYTKLTDELSGKEFRRFRYGEQDSLKNAELEDFNIINEMIKDGIIFKVNDELKINQAMKDTLENFITYLKAKKEFKGEKYDPIINSESISSNKE